jgi:hypothetical protein
MISKEDCGSISVTAIMRGLEPLDAARADLRTRLGGSVGRIPVVKTKNIKT